MMIARPDNVIWAKYCGSVVGPKLLQGFEVAVSGVSHDDSVAFDNCRVRFEGAPEPCSSLAASLRIRAPTVREARGESVPIRGGGRAHAGGGCEPIEDPAQDGRRALQARNDSRCSENRAALARTELGCRRAVHTTEGGR
jgi:hypothetical protein